MDEIEKKLKVAFYERNRYFANRIARTELHRAYTDQQSREWMQEKRIEYVELRLSAKHPMLDICDYHANVDAYGLGRGVYPKAAAPQPPFHPHCLCLLSPRIDLINPKPKRNPKAERAFLAGLPAKEAVKVAGSRDKAQRILSSKETLEDVYNQGKDALYKWKRVGDVETMPAFIRSSTVQQAEQEALKLGVKSVDYRQSLDIANEVNTALEDLQQREFAMPDHVKIDDQFFLQWAQQLGVTPDEFPAAFVNSRKTGETYLFANPLYRYWNQLAQDALQQYQRGEWSTAHKHHAIRHEIGHLLLYRANPARYAAMRTQPLTGSDLQTAHKVSLYAGTSAIEFIAETFALLVDGKTPPADVLILYNQLGGIHP